jgi:hypothetical protein
MKAFEVVFEDTISDFTKFAQELAKVANADTAPDGNKQAILKAIATGNTKGTIKEAIQKAMANTDSQKAYYGVLNAINAAAKKLTAMDKKKNPSMSHEQELNLFRENNAAIIPAVHTYLNNHYTKGKIPLPATTKEVVMSIYKMRGSE